LAAGQTPTVQNQTLASTTAAQILVLGTLVARMPSVKWSIIGRSAPVQPASFQTLPQLLVVSSSQNLAQQTHSAQKDKSATESSAKTSASMTKHVWSTRFVTTESVNRCVEEMRTVTAKRFVRELLVFSDVAPAPTVLRTLLASIASARILVTLPTHADPMPCVVCQVIEQCALALRA